MRLFERRDVRATLLCAGLGALLGGAACSSSTTDPFANGAPFANGGDTGGAFDLGSGGGAGDAAASGSTTGAGSTATGAGAAAGTRGTGATGATCTGAGCGVGTNPTGKPAQAECGAPDECGSGRCEPVTGVAKKECLSACFADGVACTKALDCCATGCHGGVCGGLCTLEGDSCKADSDCCSDTCQGGRCAIDRVNRDCRPTGEDCTSGTGRGCCNECNKRTKRCDFGADTCFAEGVTCSADSDCCRGACTAGVCKTPCAANGAACSTAGDCCTATCDASGTCVAKTPPPATGSGGAGGAGGTDAGTGTTCVPTGEKCASGAECCSEFCFGGFCEPPLR
jgi:hypothetical protein